MKRGLSWFTIGGNDTERTIQVFRNYVKGRYIYGPIIEQYIHFNKTYNLLSIIC